MKLHDYAHEKHEAIFSHVYTSDGSARPRVRFYMMQSSNVQASTKFDAATHGMVEIKQDVYCDVKLLNDKAVKSTYELAFVYE